MPGYRPPSTEPRGKWARAIHRKRRADGLSQQAAFELLGPRLGFGPKSRAAYVALDLGSRQPTEHESEVLAEWLGAYPEDIAAGEGRDTSSSPADPRLYQLLEDQSRAFNRLAAAIERMVAQPLVVPPEVAEAMHRAVAELEPPEPGTSSPPRRSDHPTSEGTPHTGNPGTGTTAPLPSGSRHP